MLTLRARRVLTLVLSLSVTPFLLGCNGDDEGGNGTGPGSSDFVGSWNATSFVAGGTDIVAGGTGVTFTFTETTYAFSVTNDANSFFCDTGVLSCGEGGDLSSTETTLTFDPGTVDEVTLNYDVTGDVMTIAGTVDGSPITATFQKQ